MSIQTKLDRLASDLANVKHQLHAVANSPQAQRTSVEGGALEFNDEDGNLKAIMGAQDDGGYTTVVVSGPVPPVPTNYGVDVDFGKAVVHWSGDFENALIAPSDWARTEVYAQPGEFVTPSREYARGSMVAASGGSVTIGLTKGRWTFCLVAWSQAGRMSLASDPVTVDIPGYGDIVLTEIDAAETAIKNAGELLVDGQKTLTDKLAELEAGGVDLEQIQQDISQARQEAIDAALEEINAVEGSLSSLIGGKNTTTWSTDDPPTEYAGVVGDTWIKLTSLGSGGREIERRRWSGTTWTVHKVDGASLSNVDASTITAGFLDVANRIRSGSIFADKLLIGGASNMVANPGFEIGTDGLAGWTVSGGAVSSTEVKRSGSKSVLFPENTQTVAIAEVQTFRVTEGDQFAVSTWISGAEGAVGTGSFSGGFRIHRADTGAEIQDGWAANRNFPRPSAANTWYSHSGEWTSPYTGDVYFRLALARGRGGDIWLDDVQVRPMVGGTLITPGGVQTPHLAADVLEVGNLKAGTAAIAEAVVKKLFAEVVVAQMVQGRCRAAARPRQAHPHPHQAGPRRMPRHRWRR